MAAEVGQFMVKHLLMRAFSGDMPVQGFFRWQIKAGTATQASFLLLLGHVLT